jgi:hypothetical protein
LDAACAGQSHAADLLDNVRDGVGLMLTLVALSFVPPALCLLAALVCDVLLRPGPLLKPSVQTGKPADLAEQGAAAYSDWPQPEQDTGV